MSYDFQLNEPVVTALVDRLNDTGAAGLQAKVDAINAAVTDGITIEDPFQVLDHVPAPSELTDFPTIGIQDLGTMLEDDIGSSATGRHLFAVLAFVQDPELGNLSWKARRYARAVASSVLHGRSLGSEGYGCGMHRPGVVYGDVFRDPDVDERDPKPPRAWFTWSAVTIWVLTDDD